MKLKSGIRVVSILSVFTVSGVLLTGIPGCSEKGNPSKETSTFNEDLYNLRLTEINYNPRDEGSIPSDSLEFIEIKNVGSKELAIGDLQFTDGVSFTFPQGTQLDAGAFFVLASSENAFETRYGFKPDGQYDGQLKDAGETIVLKDVEENEVVFSQVYASSEGWEQDADGKGYSLVSKDFNPDRSATGPEAWRRSTRLYGSPGKDDSIVTADSTLYDLRITEIHYNPKPLEEIDGDSLEFIEIKNVGEKTIKLGSCVFTNGVDYSFPSDAEIDPGEFIVIVSDVPTFNKRYPDVTPIGAYSGNLNNGGERLTLTDANAGVDIITIRYKDSAPWPSDADGDGCSLVPVKRLPDQFQDDPNVWRKSLRIGGSPGDDDPGIVLINEILTHTDTPQVDAVELYNPGDVEVNVKGWYLSDSKKNPVKYKIGDLTISAGGYAYLDEDDFNDPSLENPFTFSSHGEEAVLAADERGCDFGYCHSVSFGELENGVSIGRYITSEGKEKFVPQKDLTLGEENSGPLVGPLVISEIMYHSVDNAGDYIEVTNISGEEVILYHPDSIDYTWKISGTGYEFPSGASIRSGESVVIASDSLTVDAFRNRYDIDESVQIFQMTGKLSNDEEKLELKKPEDPYIADSTVSPLETIVPYMIFDEVKYSDNGSWPSKADGEGMSLHRKFPAEYGNDPASWIEAAPNPGTIQGD